MCNWLCVTWTGNPFSNTMKTPHVHQQQSKMGFLDLLWMCPALFYTLTSQNEHNYSCRRVNPCHVPMGWFAFWSYPSLWDRMHQQKLKCSFPKRQIEHIICIYRQPILMPFQHTLLKFWCFPGTTISDSINTQRESLGSVVWHCQERWWCSSLCISKLKTHLANCAVQE